MPAVNRDDTELRRGVALLWTLAVLLLALTTTLSVAQLAATAASRRNLARAERAADAALPAAEHAIMHWLEHQSAKVVLPPDVEQPRVEVLDELLVFDDVSIRMTITAWDQSGMMPLQAVIAGSPLRLAIDDEVLQAVDGLRLDGLPDDVPLGLDLLAAESVSPLVVFPRLSVMMLERETLGFNMRIFDSVDQHVMTRHLPIGQEHADRGDSEALALGAALGTHIGKTIRINVNSAPRRLLEAALRHTSRDGLEQIMDNRAAGRAGPVPQSDSQRSPPGDLLDPVFVSASDLWSFRIDAECTLGGEGRSFVGSSWWTVYQRSSSSTSPWTCVQRLAITE